jgi:hypoxanthine phosphoribosyltransferase
MKKLLLNTYRSYPINRCISTFCQFGWEANDPRCVSGVTVGSSLLDGNYRTVWEHLDVSVRVALVSSLSFVKGILVYLCKGGESNLPRGLMRPFTSDGHFLNRFIYDAIDASIKGSFNSESLENPTQTIFHRKYDFICPLPCSTGPPSRNNMAVTETIAKILTETGRVKSSPLSIMPFIERFQPMKTKSTAEDRNVRRSPDAPRIMHFDNMRVDPAYTKDGLLKGRSILLYDDVFTWGNTSEAARNLLLMEGAAEVDVLTVFCTGDMFRSSTYNRISEGFTMDSYKLKKSLVVSKEPLSWVGQKNLKEWHQNMKGYIKDHFPEFVPNDIPWL